MYFSFSPAPPRFLSRLESACLMEGEDIQFSCSTLTTPLPRIRYDFSHSDCCVIFSVILCQTHTSVLQVVERWQRVDRSAEVLHPQWCSEWDLVPDGHQCNRGRYWTVWVWGIKYIFVKSTIPQDSINGFPVGYTTSDVLFCLALEWVWLCQVQSWAVPCLCTADWSWERPTTGLTS